MAGRAAVVALLSIAVVGAVACSSAIAQTEEELAAGFTADNPKHTDDLYLPDGGTQPCHQLNIVGNDCRDPAGYPTGCCLEQDGNGHLVGPVCSSYAPTVIALRQVGKNFCCWAIVPFVDFRREEDATQPCGFCGGVTPGENECCTRDRDIVQKYPIVGPLEDCPDRVQDEPTHPPSTNGQCGSDEALDAGYGSIIPQGYKTIDWKPSCVEHDKCYSTCKASKAECDARLLGVQLPGSCNDFFLPQISSLVQGGDIDSANVLELQLIGCLRQVGWYRTFVQDRIPGVHFAERGFEAAQRYACRCCP